MILFCMVCRGEIPKERGKRAKTCTRECQVALNDGKRQERAEKFCRTCGRRFAKKKELEPVRSPHNAIAAKVGG